MHHRDHPNWQKTIILFLTSQCITLFGSTLVQMALMAGSGAALIAIAGIVGVRLQFRHI